MSAIYVNHASFDSWASKIDKENNVLLETLHEIQRLINSLEGEWESNSAIAIRGKITGMEDRFQQYYGVVENYAKVLRNIAAEYKAIEGTNTSNAEQFV